MPNDTSINLSNIQPKHYGSQTNSFEHLCCFLFQEHGKEKGWEHNGQYRKKGGSADAGVEAYWKFDGGEEYCLQAKFETDVFDSLLQQIRKSISTALKKHPNLTKYYVCIPIDLSDARQDSKQSQQNRWNNAVARWKKIPKGKSTGEITDNGVDFIIWGQSEIETMLINDTSLMRGLREYFFNETTLTYDWFSEHITKNRKLAGVRYSRKFSEKNSVEETLLSFSSMDILRQKEKKTKEHFRKIARDLKYSTFDVAKESMTFTKKTEAQINTDLRELINMAEVKIDEIDLRKSLNTNREYIDGIILPINDYYMNNCEILSSNGVEYKEKNRRGLDEKSYQEKRQDNLDKMMVIEKEYQKKTLLMHGDAGVGKTHLLCDLLDKSLSKNSSRIYVMVMGHTFPTNISSLEDAILGQLSGYDNIADFLDVLNLYAQLHDAYATIMVDGLNEWFISSRNSINSGLLAFIQKISHYENLKLIISYRTQYLDEIKDIKFDRIVINDGFQNPIEAIKNFTDHYGVIVDDVFPYHSDFSNPLITKLICETYKNRKLPANSQSIIAIFKIYLDNLNVKISEITDRDSDDDTISQIMRIIATEIMKNRYSYPITKKAVKESIHSIDPNCQYNWSKSILYHLWKEGGLIIFDKKVQFSYQRLGDFLIAQVLMEKVDSIEGLITQLEQLIKSNINVEGVLGFLSMLYPIKFQRELMADSWGSIDVITAEQKQKYIKKILFSTFKDSLILRDVRYITDETRNIINGYKNESFWDIMIKSAGIPNHPLNAEYLHNKLSSLSMADIDSDWSQFISHHFNENYNFEDNQSISLYHIVTPYIDVDAFKIPSEQASLLCTLFMWLTTSTNNKLRNTATLACVNVLRKHPSLIIPLFDKFKGLSDLYQKERLYIIIEGVSCFVKDTEILKLLSEIVYEEVFNKDIVYPNIIIRCSAYSIIKNAEECGVNIERFEEKITPPYNYPKIPRLTTEEVEKKNQPFKDTKYSIHTRIYNSVCMDDFGVYSIRDIDHWIDIPLSTKLPKEHSPKKIKASGHHNNTNEHKLWLYQRAYDFGWNMERHGEFDKLHDGVGRGTNDDVERIGKKYQWLAHHEYLCNLADNYYYRGFGRDNNIQPSFITAEEMASFRSIDPTILISNVKKQWDLSQETIWKRPNLSHDRVYIPASIDEQILWLQGTQSDVCKGENSFIVKQDDQNWIVLYDQFTQREEDYNSDSLYIRDFGMLISASITPQSEKDAYRDMLLTEHKNGTNGFNSPIKDELQIRYSYVADSPKRQRDVETVSNDYYEEKICFEASVSRLTGHINTDETTIHLPHFRLVELLNLEIDSNDAFQWNDQDGNAVIKNMLGTTGEDIMIAHQEKIVKLLNERGYSMVTKIAVEKRLLPMNSYGGDVKDSEKRAEQNLYYYHLTTYEIETGSTSQMFHDTFAS